MNIIEIQNVSKKFKNHTALDNLSLSIPQGRIFGLLGPNGAGKTTLIRILTCIQEPDNGQVLFNGQPLKASDVAHIGYLPEERGLYKKMKVSEQVIYLARLRGMSLPEAVKSLKFWFRKFNIESWWNRNVEELSKGMQQKIQFIVTVVHHPNFIIFDEPFSGFDPINAEQLKQEILTLKLQGATIILSTHNMASVEEICDDIALIDHGHLLLEGAVNEVRRQFRKNQFSITVEGADIQLPDNHSTLFEIISQNSDSQTTTFLTQLMDGHSSNELLSYFIQQNALLNFGEILPSMNDIFIQTVQSQNSKNL